MDIKSKEYQEHEVFTQLQEYFKFYKRLSDSVMSFLTLGTSAILNIDTYVYSSIAETLDSILVLLKLGRISDSYTLLRKYYDSAIMNVYVLLYLKDNHSIENIIVANIQDWLQGKQQLPSHRVMINYIREHQQTKDLYSLLTSDQRYSQIRDRCNDNTHYNFYRNVMLNDSEIFNRNRGKYLDLLKSDLTQLLLLHVSYIFLLCEHYMSASDYRDCLEIGIDPPENSQYWVAPFIQDIYNSVIKTYRPDIEKLIRAQTTMQIS